MGTTACLLTVGVMSGTHWLALQSYAWVRMTVSFSQDSGWRVAVQKTFNGRHPCPLCLKVQQGLREEQQNKKTPWLETEKLPEIVWAWRTVTAPAAPTFVSTETGFSSEFYYIFTDPPPTPPPRV